MFDVDQAAEDAFIAHFGVKGMRWGVRREKDPVKTAAIQAKRDGRAEKFVQKASIFDTQISELRNATPKYSFQQRGINKQISKLDEKRERALVDAEKKRQGKLSTTQKKVVIGASVAAALIAAKVTHDGIQSGDFHRLAAKGKNFLNKDVAFGFKRNEKLADMDLDIDGIQNLVVKKINPDYGGIGTKMNCRRATFAYEMRRRGYDVAATKTTNGSGQTAIGLFNAIDPNATGTKTGMFSYAKRAIKETTAEVNGGPTPMIDLVKNFAPGGKNKIDVPDAKGVFEALSTQPNGSRGELGVQWAMGGGHSMAYEIVKGRAVIFDAQSGKTFTDFSEFAQSGGDRLKAAGFTRLDDVPLNKDFLLKWLKDAN